MPKELLEETTALASLLSLLLDVPEFAGTATGAQLQPQAELWTRLMGCDPASMACADMGSAWGLCCLCRLLKSRACTGSRG